MTETETDQSQLTREERLERTRSANKLVALLLCGIAAFFLFAAVGATLLVHYGPY